jgi:hypothetical protein
MPRQRTERALSERWIGERASLLAGGPTDTFPARCWMHRIDQSGPIPASPLMLVVTLLVDAVEPAPPPRWWAEVALYPHGAEAGALPVAIVPFPVEVGTVVQQRGELAVRGELGPGRGVVAVLPDSLAVGCAGPTTARARLPPQAGQAPVSGAGESAVRPGRGRRGCRPCRSGRRRR